MNIQPLQPLAGRWPNDGIDAEQYSNIGLSDAFRAISEPAAFFKELLRIDEHDLQAISSFAAANGMQYETYSALPTNYPPQHPPAWLGYTANVTHPNLMHKVSGKLFNYDVSFSLEYVPQMSSDRGTVYATDEGVDFTASTARRTAVINKRSIIRVTLPKVFPQMVLDSNKNDQGHTSTIPTTIEPDQRLTLEGDFQNYFDFYAPVGLQVNTLTVLAPNFMQILKDGASNFDVEFYGNELILVSKACVYDPAVMTQALQALEAQLTYLDRLLMSWNYDPQAPPFDMLRYPFVNGSVVKVGKLRIRPLTMVIIVFVGFALFGILIAATN